MLSIPLGPLALPAAPLALLVGALVATALARRLAPTGPTPATGTAATVLVQALAGGLAAARVVHVGLHADAYRAVPWAVLDLRDGGWNVVAGLLAGLAWVALRALREAPWRPALAAGTLAGLAVWSAGLATIAARTPAELPDVVLTELASGAPVRLRDVAAQRPVVLNLWATWCPPCRAEMPVLAAAQDRHPDVAFVFANQGEDAAAVRRYLGAENLGLSLVLLDRSGSLAPALGSRGLPTTVVFDRHGRRVDAHLGALNGAALAAMLAAARGS